MRVLKGEHDVKTVMYFARAVGFFAAVIAFANAMAEITIAKL